MTIQPIVFNQNKNKIVIKYIPEVQSAPVQPGLQVHAPGDVHVPWSPQESSHMAANNTE